MQEPTPKYLTYQNFEKTIKIEVLFDNDTVWLTLPQMAVLFEQSEKTILELIMAGFDGDEYHEALTDDDFYSISTYNSNPDITYYNLNVITFVGDQFDTLSRTKFSIWVGKQEIKDRLEILTDSPEDLEWKKDLEWTQDIKSRVKAKGIDLDAKMLRVKTFEDFKELIIPIMKAITEETIQEEKDEEIKKPPLGPTLN